MLQIEHYLDWGQAGQSLELKSTAETRKQESKSSPVRMVYKGETKLNQCGNSKSFAIILLPFIMVNQTQKLNHLLDVRNEHLSVDSGKLTARLPIFGDNQLLTVDSKLAYFVCKTLCDLTKAEDDILWEIYGDIISRWSGSPAHTIQERLKDEKDWVRSFQHKKDPEDMAQMISDIRMALATLNLELVPTPLLPAFACYVSEDVEVLKQVTMMHHCSERNKNTIYILPFFPRIEKLIEASLLAPQTALTSGCDFDVAIVSTVKAIVHESRHLVGTLVSLWFFLLDPFH